MKKKNLYLCNSYSAFTTFTYQKNLSNIYEEMSLSFCHQQGASNMASVYSLYFCHMGHKIGMDLAYRCGKETTVL